VQLKLTSSARWERSSLPWINTVQEQLLQQARDVELVTRRSKHLPPNPRQVLQKCCRRIQTETERAPKLSGSKFIKQASSNSADPSPKAEP
jgi:hypothetical protein